MRRFAQAFLNVLFWPLRTFRRMTWDGLVFSGLAMLCAVVSARAEHLGNIPLLICLILCSVLLSALILGSRSLRGVEIHRTHAERAFAGEPVAVTLSAVNRGRVPLAGLALSEELRQVWRRTGTAPSPAATRPAGSGESQRILPKALGTQRPATASNGLAFVTAVPSRGMERVRYSVTKRRRGIYQFGRTHLDTVFPLGLWRSHAERRLPGRLIVYPRLGEIDAALFQEMEAALQRLRRSRPSREEQDFRSLREYRPGDNPKWIHWRSTARFGKTLIKEYEEPQTRRVLVLLDTNLQRLGAQRFPAFELAISFAATAVRELVRRGCEVTCLTLPPDAPPSRITLARERRNLDGYLELLATLQPDHTRTLADLRAGLRREELRHVYILVLGLGSLRVNADLAWLASSDNVVKKLDVRGEEFRRIFRRGSGSGRDELEEDLLLALGDEELDALAQEELALVG